MAILRKAGRVLQRDVYTLVYITKDPRVPWYAKALAVAVVAYALSPIDLIPDFIPFLGQLDDLVVIPLGLSLIMRMVPPPILAEHRAAVAATRTRITYWIAGALLFFALWIIGALLIFWLLCQRLRMP